MNVLIAADMEGIAGIDDYGDCLPSHPGAYARGRTLMTDEVLVAIEALRGAGAERISVGDWHMVGTNIERDRIPSTVEAEPSLTKAHGGPLDAVVFIGHHASTPNPRAFCSHTFVWDMEVLLDGESLNEVQVYAQGLAAEGIPALVIAWRSLAARGVRRGRARRCPACSDQGGPGPGERPLARRGRDPQGAGRGDRRRLLRAARPAPRAQLPGGATDHGRGQGARPHDGVRAGPPAP